jgi:hypothetical protein
MPNTQPFYSPRFRAFDSNGDPLSGGLLYAYAAGTSTPQDTYTTRAGSVANANPVVLNANGEADVWLTPNISYKFELRSSAGALQWTADNVPAPADLSLVPLLLGDGTVAAPALAFVSDPDCGLYRIGTNNLGVAIGGAKVADFSSSGAAFLATAGANPNGVTGTGFGTGTGGVFTGGSGGGTGVSGVGTGTVRGGHFANGTAATGGTRQDAVVLSNGDLDMSGVADPSPTTPLQDRLTPLSFVKVWASITMNNTASPTVNGALNVTSVAAQEVNEGVQVTYITITVAQDFADTNFCAVPTLESSSLNIYVSSRTAGTIVLRVVDTQANLNGKRVDVIAIGAQ